MKITQELYELIWTQPRSSIAKKLTITSQELVKVCKKAQIPIPPAGYIQRLRHGKNIPQRPSLSLDYQGEIEITITSRQENAENEIYSETPVVTLQREIENDQRLNLTVPKKLIAPDRLILKAQTGLAESLKSPYYRDGIVYSGYDHLRIAVSKENIDRALRIMDVLVKALKIRGHTFQIDQDSSYIVMSGQKMAFGLAEKSKRFQVQASSTRNELRLTGKLAVWIKRHHQNKQWVDGKILLEDQISKILAGLEIEAEKLKEYQLKLERGWEQQRIATELRKQKEDLKAKEFTDFKRLVADANRWSQAEMIRNYINELEKKGFKKGIELTEFVSWIEWARKKADWLDPDIELYEEALAEVDRTKLF